jgi:hypothetical protein
MFSEIRPKSCSYGCDLEIYWNTEEKTYYELNSRKKYICPNLLTYNKEPTIIPSNIAANPSYYNKEFSNTNEAKTKTIIKSKVDNSFEFWEDLQIQSKNNMRLFQIF